MTGFKKFDQDKPRVELLDVDFMRAVIYSKRRRITPTWEPWDLEEMLDYVYGMQKTGRPEYAVLVALNIMVSIPETTFGEMVLEMGRVMAFGAKKYDEENWRLCTEPRRYLAACQRHLLEAMTHGADARDVPRDSDEDPAHRSGLLTLAHAAVDLMMYWWTCKQLKKGAKHETTCKVIYGDTGGDYVIDPLCDH